MAVGKHENNLPIECVGDPDFTPIILEGETIGGLQLKMVLARQMIEHWQEKVEPEAQMSWEDEYMFLESTIRSWIRRLERFIHFNPESDPGIFCKGWVDELYLFIKEERKKLSLLATLRLKT